jgi:hypothetical protein
MVLPTECVLSALTVDLKSSPGNITLHVNIAQQSHGQLTKTDVLCARDVVVHKIDAVSSLMQWPGYLLH